MGKQAATSANVAAGDANLADHVAESVEAVASFHREHYRNASGVQRAIDAVTDRLGRPASDRPVCHSLHLGGSGGLARRRTGRSAVLRVAGVGGHGRGLARGVPDPGDPAARGSSGRPARSTTLELALLADKKSAKIIALLEELRRDEPSLAERADKESEDMAKPTDAAAVAACIEAKASERPEA